MVHSFCWERKRLELQGRLRPQERPESSKLPEIPAKSGWFSTFVSEAVAGASETSSALANTRAEAGDASILSKYAIVASEEEGGPPCHIVAWFRFVGMAGAAERRELQGPWAPRERLCSWSLSES